MDEVTWRSYLDEERECGEITLRAKWTMDGAESLAEAAAALREYADTLEELGRRGFHLMSPIEDDYGFAHRAPTVTNVELN